MDYWVIIRIGEKPKGPYSIDEVVNLPLSPESLVWHTGLSEWLPATSFDEIKGIFEEEPEAAEMPAAEPATDASLAEEAPAEVPAAEESEPAETVAEEVVESDEAQAENEVADEPAAAEEKTDIPPIPVMPPVFRPGNSRTQAQTAQQPPQFHAAQQQPLPQQPLPQQEKPECPPTYLAWSIVFTIVCCWPFGIVGIIFAILTRTRFNRGNYKGAKKASEVAEWMCILAFTFGLVFWPLKLISL